MLMVLWFDSRTDQHLVSINKISVGWL